MIDYTQEETNEIFKGFDEMMAEDEKRWNPPICHFTPMQKDESDFEVWWECKHCGHTKLICAHGYGY